MEVPRWMRGSRSLASTGISSTSSISSSSTMIVNNKSNNRLRLEEDHDRLFGRRMMQNNNDKDRNEEDEDDKRDDEAEEVPTTVDVQADTADTDTTNDPPPEEEEEEPAAVEDVEEQEQANNNDNDETVTTTTTQEGEVRIDLVRLVPFDVKLSLTSYDEQDFNGFALTDILTDWMDESLTAQIRRMELGITHSQFDSVILEERSVQKLSLTAAPATTDNDDNTRRQRDLQQSSGPVITVASYEGVTLWKHSSPDQEIVTPTLLEDIQRQVLLQDDRLLQLLQGSNAQGLGSAVNDVRAYINPNPATTTFTSNPTQPNNVAPQKSNANANLELIIVVAIVVACMAFAFLVFSLFWAWRFDQQRRDQAYRADTAHDGTSHNKRKPKSPDGSGVTSDTDYGDNEGRSSPANMNVLVTPRNDDDDTALDYPASDTNPTTGIYPESVISEDISTSLSAYYRSGMGSRPIYGSRALGNNDFNDQASFSSMESYGYSLDGYAPSLGGNTYANAVPPPAAAALTSEAADEEKASP